MQPPFDWDRDRRPHHAHDAVIYELHVKGFTARANSGVPADRRGTFAGLIERIPYLKELGVTIVELLPIHQFDPQEGNYWGYMTLNFMAPHRAYAAGDDAAREFRDLVRALHEAGIEVVLDVVYNHTSEAGEHGPTYSFRGIDNRSYIRLHDLRHTCATLLLAQGVAPKVVQEILGHSQIGLTMDTYTHVLPSLKADVAKKMDELLAAAR